MAWTILKVIVKVRYHGSKLTDQTINNEFDYRNTMDLFI